MDDKSTRTTKTEMIHSRFRLDYCAKRGSKSPMRIWANWALENKRSPRSSIETKQKKYLIPPPNRPNRPNGPNRHNSPVELRETESPQRAQSVCQKGPER